MKEAPDSFFNIENPGRWNCAARWVLRGSSFRLMRRINRTFFIMPRCFAGIASRLISLSATTSGYPCLRRAVIVARSPADGCRNGFWPKSSSCDLDESLGSFFSTTVLELKPLIISLNHWLQAFTQVMLMN